MKRNDFARQTLVLTVSSILAQFITAVVSIVLARLYTVEIIGVWSIFLSIVSIVSCISSLRYEYAIVIPDKDDEAANIVVLGFSFLVVNCISSLLILILLEKFGLFGFDQDCWQKIIMWLPVCIFGSGLFQIFNYWCVRKELFDFIAVRNVFNSLLSGILEIGFGLTMILGQEGVVIGSVLGTFCSGIFIASVCIFRNRRVFFHSIKLKLLKDVFFRYKNFPLFSTWGVLLNQLSNTIATFMLSSFFSKTVVGYYSIAQQIITLPIAFIGNAVGQVLYPNAVNALKNDYLSSLLDRTVKVLIELGVVPLLLIFLCAPQLCELVYGEEWHVAGDYIRLLTPWTLIVFVVSPLTVIFDVMGKQKLFSWINGGVFCARFVVLFLGGVFLDAEQVILLYSIIGCLSFIIVGILIFRVSRCNIMRSFREIGKTSFKLVCKYLLVPSVLVICPVSGLFQVVCCVLFGLLFLVFDGKKIYFELRG